MWFKITVVPHSRNQPNRRKRAAWGQTARTILQAGQRQQGDAKFPSANSPSSYCCRSWNRDKINSLLRPTSKKYLPAADLPKIVFLKIETTRVDPNAKHAPIPMKTLSKPQLFVQRWKWLHDIQRTLCQPPNRPALPECLMERCLACACLCVRCWSWGLSSGRVSCCCWFGGASGHAARRTAGDVGAGGVLVWGWPGAGDCSGRASSAQKKRGW